MFLLIVVNQLQLFLLDGCIVEKKNKDMSDKNPLAQ